MDNENTPPVATAGPGQPTKYRPEYCLELITHMEKGLSYEAFAALVGCSRQALYNWEEAYPEWLEAKGIAFAKSLLFWEKLAIDHIINESFGGNMGSKSLNASTWIFNMKNRFGWRDKQPDENDVVINNNTTNLEKLSDDELDRLIEEKLKGKA